MPSEAFYAGAGISPYTEHPDLPPSVIFPNHGYQAFSSLINLLGISAISWVFARRSVFDNLGTLDGWKAQSWPRLCTTLVFISSYSFMFSATMLVNGTGLSMNSVTCSLGIFSCIFLYASTKLFIYAYLMEKVWLVWSPKMPGSVGQASARWKSPLYRCCLLALSPFLVIVSLMIVGRISKIRDDGVCLIGLKGYASLSLLIYDLLITLCMTIAFVWPLTRGDIISARLRGIASRTLVASIVALITSTINISVLTSMHGKQLGWVCLASCGTDVTVNALVIAWVSRGQERALFCQHNGCCCGSTRGGGPDSVGVPQSPMPRTTNKWRARQDDVNWDPFGREGQVKMSGNGEWSPGAKLEFDFGRRGSAAGLLAPGSGDSVLGAFQEPKSPPIAVPRSGIPFSLPKVSEHATSENLGVDISSTAPGHAVYHLPLPSPRFGRRNQLPSSASQHSETTPPSSRSISLPQIPETTPGAGPSSSSNHHHKSRQRSVSKYGQETVFTQGTAQTRSEPRRSTADDVGVRGTFMRGLGSVFGLGSRSASAIDTGRGTMSPRPRASRRGLSRDDWTTSVQERMTQVTAVTDISTIVFRHADSQFETETSTIDSTDTEDSSPTPRSRPVTFNPWESSPRSTRGDEHPRSSGDDSEPGCLAHVEKAVPVERDSRPESSDGPPPYRSRPSTKESGGG